MTSLRVRAELAAKARAASLARAAKFIVAYDDLNLDNDGPQSKLTDIMVDLFYHADVAELNLELAIREARRVVEQDRLAMLGAKTRADVEEQVRREGGS